MIVNKIEIIIFYFGDIFIGTNFIKISVYQLNMSLVNVQPIGSDNN